MNNIEFYNLQTEIQEKMSVLSDLQEKYKKMTGVKFISGQVIKDPKFCDTCRYSAYNLGRLFCNCEDSMYFECQIKNGCSEHDEEDEPEICFYCNGSGEGSHDGTTCRSCGGSGELKVDEVQ